MKHIHARTHPIYQTLRNLVQKNTTRQMLQQTSLEGIHLAQMYLAHCGMPQMCITRQDGWAHSEILEIITSCQAGGCPCISLAPALYDALSQITHGPPIIFIISVPDQAQTLQASRSTVLLDRIQDPGNIGTLLRSAAAAGIEQIFASSGCASLWSPKVLRAGMGAHFLLSITENADLANIMTQSSLPVFATLPTTSTSIYDLDLRQPIAWLFGHEGQGIAPCLLALPHTAVGIPQLCTMMSLNVATAASICFFEALRQNTLRNEHA